MKDIIGELTAMRRETGSRSVGGRDAKSVVLRRRYPARVEDVWDAVTDPERIGRWFLPVTGDLRLGGKYQLQGNAGGEILRCEPPRLLAVTWIMGEPAESDVSEVRVRLEPDGDDTLFELEHLATVPADRWAEYGPGAVGVGWDLGLLSLALHLAGGTIEDPAAFESSPEAREFATRSSEAWGAALAATGAPEEDVRRMVANVTAFYVPPATA